MKIQNQNQNQKIKDKKELLRNELDRDRHWANLHCGGGSISDRDGDDMLRIMAAMKMFRCSSVN